LTGCDRKQAVADAGGLVAEAVDGVIAVRRDGVAGEDLRRIAIAARDALGSGVVVIVGASPDGKKGAVAVAVTKDRVEAGVSAAAIGGPVAKVLGGGTGKAPDFVQGGGPNVAALDDALALAREQATAAVGS